MATQKQFALVRNLLALAKSPFPAEAAAARKKADALIRKYGITKADLAPPKASPPRACPGCPSCQPMPGRVTVHMYAWWTTTGNASNNPSGTPLTRSDLERALDDLRDIGK